VNPIALDIALDCYVSNLYPTR